MSLQSASCFTELPIMVGNRPRYQRGYNLSNLFPKEEQSHHTPQTKILKEAFHFEYPIKNRMKSK